MKPNPLEIFPVKGQKDVILIKPTITRKNIEVGDFSYYSEGDFQSCVTFHHEFYGDKLIIGKFCQIGSGVNFIMNGCNHKMNSVSTFPFYIFNGWNQEIPALTDFPLKGNTIIGNDVWIGQNVTFLPGVKVGDGAIIGCNSVVSKDVEPYSIVAGNPIKFIKKRFDDELIDLLEKFRWWDKSIDEINDLIPILTDSNLENVKSHLKKVLNLK